MLVMYRKETTRHHAREINNKERAKRAKEKKQRRKEQKKSGKIAGIPHTLETLRNPDETILPKDDADLLREEEKVCCILWSFIVLRMNYPEYILVQLSLSCF